MGFVSIGLVSMGFDLVKSVVVRSSMVGCRSKSVQ
jgi:hypothetical protein